MGMVRPQPMPPFPKVGKSDARHPHAFPRRTWLRKRSPKKAKWHALYVLGLKFLIRLDPICRKCRRQVASEGHHPFGQLGALILIFFPICRACHDMIHANHNKARAEGWLF